MFFFFLLVRCSEAEVGSEHNSARKTVLGSSMRCNVEQDQELWMLQKSDARTAVFNVNKRYFLENSPFFSSYSGKTT